MAFNMLAPAAGRYDHLDSETFWRTEFPEFSISAIDAAANTTPRAELTPLQQADLRSRVLHEGYFHTADAGLTPIAEKLGTAVSRLVTLDLSPVFILLFDETWNAFGHVDAIIKATLGGDYMMLPDFWAWHVDPKKNESGWGPHRDKGKIALDANGAPYAMSVWLPLNEATPLNGCMYLVPAQFDPTYRTDKEYEWKGVIDIGKARALPAVPGDVLGWNQALLHWGSTTSPRAPHPRMSMSFEFQRADMTPFNNPQFTPLGRPDFATRLRMVAKQMLQFSHMYTLSPELRSWAESTQTT